VIVCHCRAVRAEEIRTEVRLGAETVEVVGARCGAGTRCGGCVPAVEAVMADEAIRMRTAAPVRH
jgi:bacterioferritin-associated ferredoxin